MTDRDQFEREVMDAAEKQMGHRPGGSTALSILYTAAMARLETVEAERQNFETRIWSVIDVMKFETVPSDVIAAISLIKRRTTTAESERDARVREFTRAILHGDDAHRAWLLRSAEDFIAGRPIDNPSATLSATALLAERDAFKAKLKEAEKVIEAFDVVAAPQWAPHRRMITIPDTAAFWRAYDAFRTPTPEQST